MKRTNNTFSFDKAEDSTGFLLWQVTNLSRNTKIDPMTTSTVLGTLQQKGFVKREGHLNDTRAKKVMLTTDGIKLIKKAVITVEEFDRQFFSSIGDKIEDFNGKLRALLK